MNSELQPKTALALGYFDGCHRGHLLIARATLALAKKHGADAAALTFSFGEQRLPAKGGGDLLSRAERSLFFENLGYRYFICDSFDEIRDFTGEEYFRGFMLTEHPAAMCCGEDYRFGKDRLDVEGLRALCTQHGVELLVVPRMRDGETDISATEIKRALSEGDVTRAAGLFGYDYFVAGEIKKGAHIASNLGFATINQEFSRGMFVPKAGVYASRVELGGTFYKGITNIGTRPTFYENGSPIAETHVFGFEGVAYGKYARVSLVRFIREERKFESADELSRQIARDIAQAQKEIE